MWSMDMTTISVPVHKWLVWALVPREVVVGVRPVEGIAMLLGNNLAVNSLALCCSTM